MPGSDGRAALTPETTLRRAPDQVSTTMGDKQVAMSLAAGKYFSMEGTGRDIWELVAMPMTVGAIVETMMGEYDVDRATCERDVHAFLEALLDDKLIEIVA